MEVSPGVGTPPRDPSNSTWPELCAAAAAADPAVPAAIAVPVLMLSGVPSEGVCCSTAACAQAAGLNMPASTRVSRVVEGSYRGPGFGSVCAAAEVLAPRSKDETL